MIKSDIKYVKKGKRKEEKTNHLKLKEQCNFCGVLFIHETMSFMYFVSKKKVIFSIAMAFLPCASQKYAKISKIVRIF